MNSSISDFKSLLKKLFPFLVLFLLLFTGVECSSRFILNKLFHGTKHYDHSLEHFQKRASKTEILFCGDSELYYGIDPSQLTIPYQAHNFAFPAEGIVATYHKLKHYLENEKLPNLKIVFLQFQPHSLDQEKRYLLRGYGDFSRFFTSFQLLKIYGLREWFIQSLYQSHFLKFRKLLSPQSLVGAWKNRANPIQDELTSLGFGKSVGTLNATAAEKEVLRKLKLFTKSSENSAILLHYYQQFSLLAKKHNFKLCLLQIPNYLDIYLLSNSSPSKELYQKKRTLEATFQSLKSKNKSISLLRIPFFSFSDKDFRDTAHLNSNGVSTLADLLSKKIKDLLP